MLHIAGFLLAWEGTIQWGIVPNLWPIGKVKRLDNWGWQISNVNVVLRAIDPSPTHITLGSIDWDGKRLGDIKTKCELCSRCSENCTGDCMWKDLFESLQTIPLRRAMIQRMTRMTAELPPEIGHEISLRFDGDY